MALEEIIKPTDFVGRMAVFEIKPKPLDARLFTQVLPLFFRYF